MNARSNAFELVIEWKDTDNNKVIKKELLDQYFEQEDYITFYAYILHDKDVNNETAEIIRKHYHVVIRTSIMLSKKTTLNDFIKFLMCNSSCVQCHVSYDICKSVRYLTHEFEEKDLRKHIYQRFEITTNNVEILNSIFEYNSCVYSITIEYLVNLCMKSKNIVEIYRKLSPKDARAYRNIIQDILKVVRYKENYKKEDLKNES